MKIQQTPRCAACKDGVAPPFPFSMAFQPIVDVDSQSVFAYEALVRGPQGEGAYSVLSRVTEENRYSFDQNCRVRAITLAAQLGLERTGARLSINFIPGAVYSPAACIQLTLKTADAVGLPLSKIIFEILESEKVSDHNHLRAIFEEYPRQGFALALDDFGAGFSGLNLLADLPPNILKLDMELTRNLHRRPVAQRVVTHMVSLAESLGCDLVAEGVETVEEFAAIQKCGISLMQGYLFARPEFEALPSPVFPRTQLHPAAQLRLSQHPWVPA